MKIKILLLLTSTTLAVAACSKNEPANKKLATQMISEHSASSA